MNITDFVAQYNNHPILFIGAGMSLRYLDGAQTWDGLLKKAAQDLNNDFRYYLDLKESSYNTHTNKFSYERIATLLENDFNEKIKVTDNPILQQIHSEYYDAMERGVRISPFKLYIAKVVSSCTIKSDRQDEINAITKMRKNIGSIITTNYDSFIEDCFGFIPLVGNEIILSNPYGSVYKIHGSITDPAKIILTENDYELFEKKYDLIRAQLLSLFIHNPIIFFGYSVNDENIKNLLKTIFTYVDPNSTTAKKIKNNFLLVEREEGSNNTDVSDHGITLEEGKVINIHKIKTDNFSAIYEAIANLALPISAMDIRKVQNVVKSIFEGNNNDSINVRITEDMSELHNKDMVIAIGSEKTIKYTYQTTSEMISNYFKIIEESNSQLLELINKQKITASQWFPIFGFSQVCKQITTAETLKKQQSKKLKAIFDDVKNNGRIAKNHNCISDILEDDSISATNKTHAILFNIMKQHIELGDTKKYLLSMNHGNSYKKILCLYDFLKYSEDGYDKFIEEL